MKHGVASSSSWSKSICNPEVLISRIRGSPKTTASFHLERAQTSWSAPFMIGGRVHWKSSARKVTHPSMISSLRLLDIGVPMGSGFRPWIKPPLQINCLSELEARLNQNSNVCFPTFLRIDFMR